MRSSKTKCGLSKHDQRVAAAANALRGTSPEMQSKGRFQPGAVFSTVIFKITGQHTANCGVCGRRKAQMNKWGWLGCLRPKNRKTIIGWLCEEAGKRGHQIDGSKMLALFKAAIRELLHNAKKR